MHALNKRVEKITRRKREREGRLKVDLFKDERLTEAVLEFLADTEVGRRYEQDAIKAALGDFLLLLLLLDAE
jgi:hypothetical protein